MSVEIAAKAHFWQNKIQTTKWHHSAARRVSRACTLILSCLLQPTMFSACSRKRYCSPLWRRRREGETGLFSIAVAQQAAARQRQLQELPAHTAIQSPGNWQSYGREIAPTLPPAHLQPRNRGTCVGPGIGVPVFSLSAVIHLQGVAGDGSAVVVRHQPLERCAIAAAGHLDRRLGCQWDRRLGREGAAEAQGARPETVEGLETGKGRCWAGHN
jgi:hypothetical protein